MSITESIIRTYGEPGTKEFIENENKSLTSYLGDVIKDIRRQRNMTKTDVINKVPEISHFYLTKIEKGEVDIKVSTLFKIIDSMGYEIQFNPKK